MIRSPALLSLQASLLAAMGFAACGGNVVVDGNKSGSGGGTTTTTGTGAGTGECAGAVPVPTKGGAYSGFARCPDGTVHRLQPVAPIPRGRGAGRAIDQQRTADGAGHAGAGPGGG